MDGSGLERDVHEDLRDYAGSRTREHAVEHGATALGFVFWPASPRYVAPEQAAAIVARVPPSVATVGVFVNERWRRSGERCEQTGISTVQLHGDEPASYAAELDQPVLTRDGRGRGR